MECDENEGRVLITETISNVSESNAGEDPTVDDKPTEEVNNGDTVSLLSEGAIVVHVPNNASDKPVDEVNNGNTAAVAPEGVEVPTKTKRVKGKGRGRRMTNVTFLPSDCKLCGEKFASDKALGYHIRDVHVVGKNNPENVKATEPVKKTRHRYVRHGKGNWRVANPKRPYACQTCGKRFMYDSSLTHHQIKKHNEVVPIEGTKESYSESMLPKLYSHTFQCDQCGKILMSKQSLITHLVSFHGTDHEKPFQCDICGQRYVSISSLVSHRRREHTGDKPYVCEHCNKAFTMSNRLKCHLRVHSDEKYYKCNQCSKEFKSCSAFRAHKDTHEGVMRHTCKFCGRKFLFQGNMIKHIRRRHPNGEKLEQSSNNHDDSAEESCSLPPNTPSTIQSQCSELQTQPPQSQQNHFNSSKESSASITSVASASQHSSVQQSTTQQQPQGIVSVSHLVQPEIQFQVLPMPLANQDMFNGISYQQTHHDQQHHLHTSAAVQLSRNISLTTNIRDPLTAGGCRFCDQHYPDIRHHLTEFHRIPVHKLEISLQESVYY